jgi:rod shape determining protein RodA
MFRQWVLPSLLLLFALLSILILRSVAPTLLSKQVFFFVGGAIAFTAASFIDFRRWKKLAPYLYILLIFLLILTRVIGKITRGAASWIPIGPLHIEPSQIAVLTSGVWLSFILEKKPIQNFTAFLRFVVIAALPAVFIFLEPDLGTTTVYCFSMACLFFLSQTKWSYIIGTVLAASVLLFVGWNFLLHPYQKERITSFLNVSENQTGSSYNAIQSVIAVGSGELVGRGLGQGVQSHLRFLPERQTDFVFASLAEETGYVGSLIVICLYVFFVFFLIFIAAQTSSLAQQYFCLVTAAMISVQAVINIGMNMGLLPITGITLPLISYGGSSILALCFQYGCIQAIILHLPKKASMHLH